MSIKTEGSSSTYMRSARKNTAAMTKTQPKQGTSLSVSEEPQVVVASSSNSPLRSVYDSAEFSLAWDNEVSFHLARHALQLRKYRRSSQVTVAKAMGTSQAKVARIEGGDENVTLNTLKKLAAALKGRIRLSIEPMEVLFPRLPDWWQVSGVGLASGSGWELRGMALDETGSTKMAGAVWTAIPQSQTVVEGLAVLDSGAQWELNA